MLLISRDCKWKTFVCKRKDPDYRFTKGDYKKSLEMAVNCLPEDLDVTEVSIITDSDAHYLFTEIYWKELKQPAEAGNEI